MTPILLSIPLAAIANALRGEDKPTSSEQANRAIFGAALALPALAVSPLAYLATAIGGFATMLIPHGQWWKFKYPVKDRLAMLAVHAARGALVFTPALWGHPTAITYGILWSALAGCLALEAAHYAQRRIGYHKARADILWHGWWAALMSVGLIVGMV